VADGRAARARADALRPVVAAVAASATGHPVTYAALQAAARHALAEAPPPVAAAPPARVVETWWCATCGRVEAPQPCIGVCVHTPEDMVAADEHARAADAARAAHDETIRLERLVRLLATVTPRAGQVERTLSALRAPARSALVTARSTATHASATSAMSANPRK
jgi:hypothetical protein